MIYANIYTDGHSNNSLFGLHDPIHRHNPTYIPRALRETFLANGIEINTPDCNEGHPVSFDIHLEGRPLAKGGTPRFLIALENPHINPLNCNRDHLLQFDKAFSWDLRVQDMANVVPIVYPHALLAHDWGIADKRTIFSCLINANKAYKTESPGDLYKERLKTIRWYEQQAPGKFELYGLGWDKATPAFTLAGRLQRSMTQAKSKLFGLPPFPSYKGEVALKSDVLKKSCFTYCYENSTGLDNYITEKIFDALTCGCIPIYWGAGNIQKYVPEGCFIDRSSFESTAEVHRYISQMTEFECQGYRHRIKTFLSSKEIVQFSAATFANTIVQAVCKDLGLPYQPTHPTPEAS